MTAVNLDVAPGTRLRLRAGEWFPQPGTPAQRGEVVSVVAVYRQEIHGRVWVKGHACRWPDPDCGTGACFEHQVSTSAIRANLAGDR